MDEKQAGLFDGLRDTLTPELHPECLWLVLKMAPQYHKPPGTQILDATAILRVKEDVCWNSQCPAYSAKRDCLIHWTRNDKPKKTNQYCLVHSGIIWLTNSPED